MLLAYVQSHSRSFTVFHVQSPMLMFISHVQSLSITFIPSCLRSSHSRCITVYHVQPFLLTFNSPSRSITVYYVQPFLFATFSSGELRSTLICVPYRSTFNPFLLAFFFCASPFSFLIYVVSLITFYPDLRSILTYVTPDLRSILTYVTPDLRSILTNVPCLTIRSSLTFICLYRFTFFFFF